MATKIQRWGNSLGVRIPKSLAEQIGVVAGTPVLITVRGGELVLRPRRRAPYRLEELLSKVTRRNLHDEVDTGAPVGRETW